MSRPVGLVALRFEDEELLDRVSAAVERAYGRAVLPVTGMRLDPDRAWDPARRQHQALRLLEGLRDVDDSRWGRILGVTGVDLCTPVLTFVFGCGDLGGRAALVSTARLEQEFYGLPADRPLLLARAEKEANHEVGHTFGLLHCDDWTCVMSSSRTVEDVDLKGTEPCRPCRERVRDG